MGDKKKESASDFEVRKHAHFEYLEKNEISKMVRSGLLKLIENQPDEPMLFLANYFDQISTNERSDKVNNAIATLKLAHHSHLAFQTNLMIAYDIISAPKNPSSKKIAIKRPGLVGSVYQELMTGLIENMPSEITSELLKKISCQGNEVVLFSVFSYGVTACFLCLDFMKLSRNIFPTLCGKFSSSVASKSVCDTIIGSFSDLVETEENTDQSDEQNLRSYFNAAYQLRPDYIAENILSKNDNTVTMSDSDFVYGMVEVFIKKMSILK